MNTTVARFPPVPRSWPFQEASETFDAGRNVSASETGVDASAEAEELALEAMVEVMEVINGAEAKPLDPLEAGMSSEWLRLVVLINEDRKMVMQWMLWCNMIFYGISWFEQLWFYHPYWWLEFWLWMTMIVEWIDMDEKMEDMGYYYDGILDTDDNDDKKIRGGWADSFLQLFRDDSIGHDWVDPG